MPTLSHSQVETWNQCARRWQLQKLERAPQAPSEALILGDAIHQALEADGRALMGDGAGLSPDAVATAFQDSLLKRLKDDDPSHLISADARLQMHHKGESIIRAYVAHLQPRYAPTAVEESFSVDIPGAPSWRFTGRIDARVMGMLGIPLLVDFKTAGKPWPSGAEHEKQQVDAYLWAAREAGETAEVRMIFAVFPVTEDGHGGYNCFPQFRYTSRMPEQLDAYPRYLTATARAITLAKRTGDFPARTGPLCAYCGVLGSCATGRQWLTDHNRKPAIPMLPVTGGGDDAA